MNTKDSVMVLATTFKDKGDWTVEQQFVLQMGSSYLFAHGLGTPLEKDAVTDIEIPEDGEYRLCLLYTSPSPRDSIPSRMPSSA